MISDAFLSGEQNERNISPILFLKKLKKKPCTVQSLSLSKVIPLVTDCDDAVNE